jgi:hypothetical protein
VESGRVSQVTAIRSWTSGEGKTKPPASLMRAKSRQLSKWMTENLPRGAGAPGANTSYIRASACQYCSSCFARSSASSSSRSVLSAMCSVSTSSHPSS